MALCKTALMFQVREDGYSLGTEYRRLSGVSSPASLTPSDVNFLTSDYIPDGEPVTLREAARRASGGTGQGILKCTCKHVCRAVGAANVSVADGCAPRDAIKAEHAIISKKKNCF